MAAEDRLDAVGAIVFGTGREWFRNPGLRAGPLGHGGQLTEVVSDEPGQVQPEQSGQQPQKPQIVSGVHTADSLNARDAVKLIRSSVRCPLLVGRELSPANSGSTHEIYLHEVACANDDLGINHTQRGQEVFERSECKNTVSLKH